MAEARGVLIIGEVSEGQLSGTTKEVLAAGRTLAQQAGTALAVGLVGGQLASAAQRLTEFREPSEVGRGRIDQR